MRSDRHSHASGAGHDHDAPHDGGRLVIAAIAAVFATMLAVAAMPPSDQRALLAEGALIEAVSAMGYWACIALMLALWPFRAVLARWYFVVLLAFCTARELDLDKRGFTEGLLKARQYTGDTVALPELVLSALILAALIATVLVAMWREVPGFLRLLVARNARAYAVLVGFAFIFAYKAIDGAARKLEPFGITLGDALETHLLVVEEVGEMGIPLLFALAIALTARTTYANQG